MGWTDRTFFTAAVLVYGLSAFYSIFLFRKGFRQDNRVTYLLLLFGFVLHTAAMLKRGFSFQRCPISNLYEATIFVVWTLLSSYLLIGAWSRLRFLGAFVSPFLLAIGVFALMPGLDDHGPTPSFAGAATSLHAALILLSYGAFGLGCVGGVMYLFQENNLKYHKLRAVSSLMPPIQRLETVTSRALVWGFGLLTAGLAVGAFFVRPPSAGIVFWRDPKVQWSAFVWLLYLVLLLLRWRFAQRGRRIAIGAIGSFAFIMLTFWGFNLLSGIHNP